jgi:hypothetical protein
VAAHFVQAPDRIRTDRPAAAIDGEGTRTGHDRARTQSESAVQRSVNAR